MEVENDSLNEGWMNLFAIGPEVSEVYATREEADAALGFFQRLYRYDCIRIEYKKDMSNE